MESSKASMIKDEELDEYDNEWDSLLPSRKFTREATLFLLLSTGGFAVISSAVFFQIITVMIAWILFLSVAPILVYRMTWSKVNIHPSVKAYTWGFLTCCFGILLAQLCLIFWPYYMSYESGQVAILGALTNSSVRITVYAQAFKGASIEAFPRASPEVKIVSQSFPFGSGSTEGLAHAALEQLEADVEYEYQVALENAQGQVERPNSLKGSFRTLPTTNESGNYSRPLVFGSASCVQKNRRVDSVPMTAFSVLRDLADLDFFLFLGDFVYVDIPFGVGYAVIGYGADDRLYDADYRRTLLDDHVKEFVQNVPTAWMFDDHEILNDYDGGNATVLYATAMRNWEKYLGKTTYDSSPSSSTRSYSFSAGNGEFYMLDTRTQRDAELGTMIGPQEVQDVKNWLLRTQAEHSSSFKFLVSPVPFTRNHPFRQGGWNCGCPKCEPLTEKNEASCPKEREVLVDFVVENNITGVVLISGDSHKPGVFELAPGIVEISASPISALAPPAWNGDKDKTIYEEGGLSTAFAVYEMSQKELVVTIYASGYTMGLQLGLIISATLFVAMLVAMVLAKVFAFEGLFFEYLTPRVRVILLALFLVLLLLCGYFLLPFHWHNGFDEPRFQYRIPAPA